MKKLNRRDFLKSVGTLGATVAAAPLLSQIAFATDIEIPDLVAVRGDNIEEMLKVGLEAYGGLPIKKGDKVCIKPNMAWAIEPEGAANTNPDLLRRLIEETYKAGASSVTVFDNTCDDWVLAYEKSGLQKVAEEAGAKVVGGNLERYYREVSIPEAKTLKTVKIHEQILDSDVVINVPVLKHHGGAGLSCAMKNLMGAVWDRRFYHSHGLNQCIADACLKIKPTLNIVDAYKIMLNGGPRSNNSSQYKLTKTIMISKDIVAIDVASARTFGESPEKYEYITLAAKEGVGKINLSELNIKRISL